MRVKLVDHPEHGLQRLRDDYYARRRAIVGGIVLASALILGQIVSLRIDNHIVAYLAQMIISAVGFAYGLICAAWPNNPRQTTMGIVGGTAAFCLLALGGGLLMALVILLIAFVPAAAGSLPGIGGALLGILAVLFGGVAGTFMVVGTAVIICLAGFITLRIAAGAEIDDELVNQTMTAATNKKRFIPALSWLIGAALMAIAAVSVLNMGTTRLLNLSNDSAGMTELVVGLDYLVGFKDVGVALASTGNATLSDLLAGLVTTIGAAFTLGLLLALPMAITARGLLIYMSIEGADFSVAHAASLRITEEEEPPPIEEDPESLANLDLREAVQRPEGWHPEAGRASNRELLQVKRRDTEVQLEERGSIPGLDD
mgnify:FL=1